MMIKIMYVFFITTYPRKIAIIIGGLYKIFRSPMHLLFSGSSTKVKFTVDKEMILARSIIPVGNKLTINLLSPDKEKK